MRFHRIKMRYSIEPRDRVYVKEYGFLSFEKTMGKNLSNKYGEKLLAEGTGDLIVNKIEKK